jgi:predicted protein tyrosine phosphatase
MNTPNSPDELLALRYRYLLLRGFTPTRALPRTPYAPAIWVDSHQSIVTVPVDVHDGIILIEDSGAPALAIAGFPRSVLRLRFDDVVPGHTTDSRGRELTLFTDAHAEAICTWYTRFAQERGILHVACLAGVSRSRAIAAALLRLRGDEDLRHFQDGQPNGHVYVTMLGLPPLDDYLGTLEAAYAGAPLPAIRF